MLALLKLIIISILLTKICVFFSLGLSHFMAACAGSDIRVPVDYLMNPANSRTALVLERVNKFSEQLTYLFKNYSPLHFAAEFGRQETVKLLLANGAHCQSCNNSELMHLDFAVMNELQQTADQFMMQCLRYDWSLDINSYSNNEEQSEESEEMSCDEDDSGYCENNSSEDGVYSDSDEELAYWEDDIESFIL